MGKLDETLSWMALTRALEEISGLLQVLSTMCRHLADAISGEHSS
jgi:hypothetical protein